MSLAEQLSAALLEAEIEEKGTVVTAKVGGGRVHAQRRGRTLTIIDAHLDSGERGKGKGVEMYVALADYAKEHGLRFLSDSTVEDPAMQVWMALKRRGYKVKLHPRAVKDEWPDDVDLWRVGDGSSIPVVSIG